MVSSKDVLKKYRAKIESEFSPTASTSQDYSQFKKDMMFTPSRYERFAQSLGSIIKVKVAEKDKQAIARDIAEAHLDVTPEQALSLSMVSLVLAGILTLLATGALYFITQTFPALFFLLGIVATLFIFYYVNSIPKRMANAWKLSASSQMVPAILYMVVYMKHTSNLERAIEFAAQHLEGPLGLDFKKIFYDVEVAKYTTIKQSIDAYLQSWRIYAPEFVESFHLIESSLYEPSDQRRVQILEKALQVILDGVYEKMLKYSREIRSPITNIYMLGIILPTLGLALLPLASTLLGGVIQWYHVLILFTVIIPFFVWYLSSEVLLKRPGGYGESSILELNPDYPSYADNTPWITNLPFLLVFLLIGLLPFVFQITFLTDAFSLKSDYTLGELGLPFATDLKLFDFKDVGTHTVGPFGIGSLLLSLCIPLGIGLYISRVYRQKTKKLMRAREDTKLLEEEFTTSLFQLGNRLGDGIPAEIAFAKVAESTQGQKTQAFFAIVNQNIQQLGLSLDRALFDPKRGAIISFPSPLIATSMRILVESVKKGLAVAARSLMSISEYVKNIQKINERLRDLLAEIVSDMKSNMTFLAPLLSGIVVGLAAMITAILNKLEAFKDISQAGGASGLGSLQSIPDLFNVASMIPPYFIQITIGIYIIEVIAILTAALVTVDSGRDPLREKYELASYLRIGLLLYIATALAAILALSALATIALGSLAG